MSRELSINDLYNPTQQSHQESLHIQEECNRLGLPCGEFNEHTLEKDEISAIALILSGKKVPKDIEERLINTKEDRLQERKSSTIQISDHPTNEEIEEFLKSDDTDW